MPVCFLNSAITGCIGTKYGDQIIPLTSAAPAALAAATVRSSIDAARANGVVPGMRFATVNPTPASMNLRREMFMGSSLAFFFAVQFGHSLPAMEAAFADLPRYSYFRPLIDVIVGGDLAIRNTVCPRMTIGHAAMALRSQIPIVVFMVGYTMLSLWILSQPIVETNPAA